jgi:hypothetical protein
VAFGRCRKRCGGTPTAEPPPYRPHTGPILGRCGGGAGARLAPDRDIARLSAFRFPFSLSRFFRVSFVRVLFLSSLPGLTRQSMRPRRCFVPTVFRKPQLSMDHRVKPGGDEKG